MGRSASGLRAGVDYPRDHIEFDGSVPDEVSHPVPFIIMLYMVRPERRPKLPAISHEDCTGRVQSEAPDQNELYYDLITRFQEPACR